MKSLFSLLLTVVVLSSSGIAGEVAPRVRGVSRTSTFVREARVRPDRTCKNGVCRSRAISITR